MDNNTKIVTKKESTKQMKITYVKCPNCKQKFTFEGSYNDIDVERSCLHCEWTCSTFSFDYINEESVEDNNN